jgi:hypothetical protein
LAWLVLPVVAFSTACLVGFSFGFGFGTGLAFDA